MTECKTADEIVVRDGSRTRSHRPPTGPRLDDTLAQSASAAASLFDCAICVITLTEGGELVVRAAAGLDLNAIGSKRIPHGKSLSGRVAMQSCPRLFDDVSEYLGTIADNLEPYYSGPLASLPLRHEGRTLGLLNLCRPGPANPFSSEDLRRMAAYADQTALLVSCHFRLDQGEQELRQAVAEADAVTDRLCQCVSARNRAEQALSETAKLHRQVIERTNDGIIVIQNGLVKYANPRALEMTGRPPEELLGVSLFTLLGGDQVEEGVPGSDRIVEDQLAGSNFEAALKHKNGARVEVDISTGTLTHGGQPAVLMMLRDITQRKQIEAELRKSEERHRMLFQCSRDAMMTLAPPSWKFTSCNPAAVELFGARDEMEFTSSGPGDVSPEMQQDGRPSVEAAQQMIGAALREGSQFFEWTHKRLSGEDFPASVLLTRMEMAGMPFLLATVRDRTAESRAEAALRESEARIRSITESAQDAIIMLDPDGNISTWNPAAERIFGYSAGEVLGRNAHDLLVPRRFHEDYHRVFPEFRRTGQGSAVGKTIELPGLRKTGEEFSLELSLSSVHLSDGWHAVGVARDITQRKQRDEERARMHTQLLQAQRLESIGQLAAGIAHEINTPTQYAGDNVRFLQDACGSVWNLLDKYGQLPVLFKEGRITPEALAEIEGAAAQTDLDFLRAEVPRAIEQSLEGIERISKIVSAMKEFSHPGPAEKAPTDINRCLASTIAVSKNEWKYAADLETEFDESLPHVPCLQGPFNQAMLNLLVNAAHAVATAAGASGQKGRITVSTRMDGGWIEIRVADTGTGIPESIRSRIFEPFFTTKEVGKGTGQGLAICHSVIVGKLGGTIGFETEMGRGTVFIVRLPLEAVPETPEGESEEAHTVRR